MSVGVQKTCRVCGRDVSQIKRTKDSRGNYYCNPCWDEKVQSGNAAAPVASAMGDPVAAHDITSARSAQAQHAPLKASGSLAATLGDKVTRMSRKSKLVYGMVVLTLLAGGVLYRQHKKRVRDEFVRQAKYEDNIRLYKSLAESQKEIDRLNESAARLDAEADRLDGGISRRRRESEARDYETAKTLERKAAEEKAKRLIP